MFTAYRPGHTCSALKRSRRTRRSPSFLGTTNSNLSAVSALPTYPLARSLTQSLIRLSRKLFGNISRQASPASLLPSSSSPIAFITDDNWGDATEQTFSAESRQRRSEREGGRQAGRPPLHSIFSGRVGSHGCITPLLGPSDHRERRHSGTRPTTLRSIESFSSSPLPLSLSVSQRGNISAARSLARSLGEIKNNQGGGRRRAALCRVVIRSLPPPPRRCPLIERGRGE